MFTPHLFCFLSFGYGRDKILLRVSDCDEADIKESGVHIVSDTVEVETLEEVHIHVTETTSPAEPFEMVFEPTHT